MLIQIIQRSSGLNIFAEKDEELQSFRSVSRLVYEREGYTTSFFKCIIPLSVIQGVHWNPGVVISVYLLSSYSLNTDLFYFNETHVNNDIDSWSNAMKSKLPTSHPVSQNITRVLITLLSVYQPRIELL